MKNRPSLPQRLTLVAGLLLLSSLACALPGLSSDVNTANMDTAVANTLTAIASLDAMGSPSGTATSTLASEASTPSATRTLPPTATLTASPPPQGLSYECDGSYQRTQLIDLGEEGKTLLVEHWIEGEWIEAWRHEEADPMISQIETEAGPHLFGTCQYLLALPIRYSGSGANLVLRFYRWNGATMEEVYFHEGVHGDWSKSGDVIRFQESVYLYNEANCCPCNRQFLEHTWDGDQFIQTGSLIEPTYDGDPPEHCQP